MALTAQQVQLFYIGYYARPADPIGLEYWQTQDEASALAGFSGTEFIAQFAGMSISQQVTKVYGNLLGRAPDATGLLYWAGEISAGRETIGTLVMSMITNALGKDVTTIADRVTYSTAFTAAINTVDEINAYAGAAATQAARDALLKVVSTAVDDHAALTAETAKIDTTIAAIVSGGGTSPGQTFALTAGIDTASSNQFVANPVTNALGQINQTFNTGDKLTGTGTNPTLTVLDTGAAAAAVTPTLTGVETLNYTNFAAAGPAVITGNNITGLKNINVSNSTQGLTVNALQTKVEKVGITNTGTATVVQVANAALAGTTDEVSVTLSKALNGSSLQLNAVSGANGYETIKVNVTGENSVINAITTNTANTKTITFAGDKDLTVGAGAVAPLSGSLTTIDASNLTGKFVLGGVPTAATASSAFATVAGAATGSVTITGTGKDDVIALSDLGQQYKIVGGDGADTLVVTAAAGAATVATVGTGAASITGIETLRVVDGNGSALAGNVTVNLLGTSGITALQLSNGTAGENANVVTLNNQNHVAGFSINAVGTGQTAAQIFNGVTYAPLGVTGATDKVTLNVGNNGVSVGAGNNITIGAMTLTGIEQVTVNVKDLSSTSTLLAAANPFNAAGLTAFEFNVEGGNTTAGSIGLGNVGGAAVANAVINSGAGVTAAIGNIAAGGTSVVLGGAGNHTITLLGNGATVINGSPATGNLNLTGGGGADTIIGAGGNDTITGGAGADNITLGAGNDTLVFNSLVGADTIADYVVANDSIQLSIGTYAGLGAIGALTAAEFVSGAGVVAGADATDRIVYNTTTGDLYYDADGNGAGAAVLIGTFTGAPVLVVGEFTIVT